MPVFPSPVFREQWLSKVAAAARKMNGGRKRDAKREAGGTGVEEFRGSDSQRVGSPRRQRAGAGASERRSRRAGESENRESEAKGSESAPDGQPWVCIMQPSRAIWMDGAQSPY